MSRIQLALRVSDLQGSIDFYRSLFGIEPAKLRPGYANFAITEPPLKLVLIEGDPGQPTVMDHLGVEVEEPFGALARRGLVGGHDDPLDPRQVVQRLERHHHLDGRAVGVGDDAAGDVAQGVGVDLGDDQRHLGVHAPGAGVVDDDGTGLRGDGAVLAADRRRRARQDDVDAGKGLGPQRDDVVGVAPKLDRFAGAGSPAV